MLIFFFIMFGMFKRYFGILVVYIIVHLNYMVA